MLDIKKNNGIAIHGKTREFDHENRKVIAYSREYEGSKLFVVGNFSRKTVRYKLPEETKGMSVLLNNYPEVTGKDGTIVLEPYQALLYQE